MPTPRDLAFKILSRWTIPHDPPFLPERSDPEWAALSPRDRPFAFDLLAGIMRWRNALDSVIASRLRQPIESLEHPVRALLWLGAYQVLFQETAAYASVDTTVTLARRARPKAAGLVNAVLRNILRLKPRRVPAHASLESAARLSHRALALDFETELHFAADIFPDPATTLTAHLAATRSHPALYVDHLRKIFAGNDSLVADLLLRNNQRPLITLRADAAQLDVPAAAGLVAHGQAPQFLVAAQGWNEAIEKLVSKGTLSPQDPTAALPVRSIKSHIESNGLPAPKKILDLCAGLGTKTLQLARAFPDAAITATDVDAEKLQRLMHRAKQAGQKNMQTLPLAQIENQKSKIKNPYDLILVDVPCSNTGVFARRVQSRWRWPTLDHAALAALQLQLLAQAAAHLSRAGILVYSTCSIDPAENQQRMQQFIATHPAFKTTHEQSTLPSLTSNPVATHDGGYFAFLTSS